MGRLSLQSGDLFYEEKGAGTPIVLLHAGVADNRMWDDQFYVLAEHHRVVRCDLRGYGKSQLPNGPFAYHEDIQLLIDELGLSSTWLVGASFGAQVAVDYYLSNPKRVRGLVLVSPVVSGLKPTDEIKQFNESENALLEAGNLEEATELNLRMWVEGPYRSNKEVDAPLRNKVADMQMKAFSQPFPEAVSLLRLDPPAIERLHEIQVPTLVVSGALDVPGFVRFSEELVEQVPGAKRVVIPAVAHVVSMEAPQTFIDLVFEFISEHENR